MEDLFEHGLKDIYFAEKKILEALPKVAGKVKSQTLRRAMEKHVEETREQVRRLDKVFKQCDLEPGGEKCPAIEGLVKEAEQAMSEIKDADVLSAALLSGAQAVEHYEISRYGTLCAWARMLGYDDSVPLLEETLEEEKNTDKILTDIALEEVNEKASA
jgi:ferritin-like metal-binding protein YciE